MAAFEISSALGGAGSADKGDVDWVIVLSLTVAALGLAVLIVIAVSNWRADHALKQVRKECSAFPTKMRRGLTGENVVKPNPLRKTK